MAGEFDISTGRSSAEADIRAQQLHDMSMATDAVHLEAARMQLDMQKKEIAQMSKILGNQGPPVTVEDQAQIMFNAAYVALANGDVERGGTLMSQGQNMMGNELTRQKMRNEIAKQNADKWSSLLATATPASWQALRQKLPPQYQKIEFGSPEYEEMKTGIMSAAERIRANMEGLQAKEAQIKIDNAPLEKANLEARTAVENQRAKNLKKTGEDAGSDRVGEVYAAMADAGVSFPSGMRSVAAQRQTIQGLLKSHPDDSAEQIAQRVRSGLLGFKASGTEANVVARREGSAAAAINALNREGGLYDQALEVGKKVDFSANKIESAWKLYKQGKLIADPDLSEYINVLNDTRAEFASVLARGGQVTDSVRIASEHAFPDKMSYSELSRNVSRSKKVAEAIQAGNTAVIDAIVNGKSLQEAIKTKGTNEADKSQDQASGGFKDGEKSQDIHGRPTIFKNGKWVYQ